MTLSKGISFESSILPTHLAPSYTSRDLGNGTISQIEIRSSFGHLLNVPSQPFSFLCYFTLYPKSFQLDDQSYLTSSLSDSRLFHRRSDNFISCLLFTSESDLTVVPFTFTYRSRLPILIPTLYSLLSSTVKFLLKVQSSDFPIPGMT